MRKHFYTSTLILAFGFVSLSLFGQVTVAGPSCVVPGTTYQYLINGPWDSASTMQVCVTGGLVAGSNSTCTTNGAPHASVLVIWGASGSGSVTVSSSKGSGTISVNITSVLTGGTIPASARTQSIAYKGTPSVIDCSTVTGGSCSPSYQYQWQQSRDRLNWTDIPGAQGLTLSLGQALEEATFYRRRVTETGSGTVAYSDIAFIDVSAPPPSTSVTH